MTHRIYPPQEPLALVSADGTEVSRRLFADPQLYQRELESIFQRQWIYLGHGSQIPQAGDFIQAWIGETPLIVAWGEDMGVHVSINSCTHRGVPVCRADRGNAKRFVCPYHNWSYSVEGKLVAIPQEKKVCTRLDKHKLGLKPVPRIAFYHDMIFGCMDASVIPLEDYLGDMRWYLDCLFDRYDGGVEVIGAPHKWLLHANWKMPVENQLGDVGHGPYLHGSLLRDTPAVAELEAYGHNIVPQRGHGVSVRLMPEGTPAEKCMWGIDGIAAMDPEVHQYLLEQHHKVAERLGQLRARIRPLCYSLYPNFSMLWPNGTLRISHPRGPDKTEYWSWFVIEKNAPDFIKKKMQQNYTFFFGPGGVLEQEDSEAWAWQQKGSAITGMDDTPYYYGLGLGEAQAHSELPGMVGSCFDEHYAREYYLRWQDDMNRESAGK